MADEPIMTDVGTAGFGDNFVRGRSVENELFGRDGYWSVYSLGLGGPRLSPAQNRLLDDLGVACVAGDPRIWPLKVTWLVAAYGSAFAGMAAVTTSLVDAYVGPDPASAAARICEHLRGLYDAEGTTAPLVRFLDEARSAGKKVAGFGVPGRKGGRTEDERNRLMAAAAHRHELVGRHLEVVERLVRDLPTSASQPNGALYLNAILLDLGFRPEQTPLVCMQLFNMQFWAHAFEAARLRPRALQSLSPESVRYRGVAPRRSTRASKPR